MIELGVYVHMPWCVRKCPYCDFNSHQLKQSRPDAAYIDALLRDLDTELPGLDGRIVGTVFFGGGTPSLFAPEDLSRLMRGLRERMEIAPDAEVTLEANPGTVERGRFAGYAAAGINRVSLGAQSFSAAALQKLGRIHDAEDTHRAVEELREAGLTNFNLDVMYALPDQNLEEAVYDVRTAIGLNPTHLSYYQLTLEPGTVFHSRPPPLPDEETAWQIQSAGQALLAAAGYERYEVSAYARAGARCRHNLNYWSFGDYLGLGAGAHGKLTVALPDRILRTSKPKQPREYLERIAAARAPVGERNWVPESDVAFEFMLNALRLDEGFDDALLQARTGLGDRAPYLELCRAAERGLIERRVDGWRPTDLGKRFLNDLQASFLV